MHAATFSKKLLSIAVLVAIGLTSACGGSPNTPDGSFVGSGGNPGGPPTRLVDIKVTVTVPSRAHGVNPNYVSPNTESLAIQLASVNGKGVTGVNPTIVNTVPKARDCKAGGPGDARPIDIRRDVDAGSADSLC